MNIAFFVKLMWPNPQVLPLGGLSKREVFVPLLRTALNRIYLNHSQTLAKSLAIPLTRAHG